MQVQVLFPAPKSGRIFVRISFMFVLYAERLSTTSKSFVRKYSLKWTFFRPEKPTHDTTHDTEMNRIALNALSSEFNKYHGIHMYATELLIQTFY